MYRKVKNSHKSQHRQDVARKHHGDIRWYETQTGGTIETWMVPNIQFNTCNTEKSTDRM